MVATGKFRGTDTPFRTAARSQAYNEHPLRGRLSVEFNVSKAFHSNGRDPQSRMYFDATSIFPKALGQQRVRRLLVPIL